MAEHPATLLFACEPTTPALTEVSTVCIGTGRFLRTVLVPALEQLGGAVVLAQTRGTSFGSYLAERPGRDYEVDTVARDGKVATTLHRVALSGSLGLPEGRRAFMELPTQLPKLRFLGLGLTEAGIYHNGASILQLAEFLHGCFRAGRRGPLSVINTDNLPFNGDAIRGHVAACDFTRNSADAESFTAWLGEAVHFHNSMVDGITSQREGHPEVPRAEPLPEKALVIEDLAGVLPEELGAVAGVQLRSKAGELALDIAMKLRIANGLHTAMVYVMALGGLFKTDACIGRPDVLPYLQELYERDVANMAPELGVNESKIRAVFEEWMLRLQHPHFGLECLFVCQNASQKLGIRLLPSVQAALAAGKEPSKFMALAIAAILRFLTPMGEQPRQAESPPVFVGRMDPMAICELKSWEYTPGLRVSPQAGTYEFRDGDGTAPMLLLPLGQPNGCSLEAAQKASAAVLSGLQGFDAFAVEAHRRLSEEVARLLQRMLSGEQALALLASLLK